MFSPFNTEVYVDIGSLVVTLCSSSVVISEKDPVMIWLSIPGSDLESL
jgi:hypothetical protein